MAFDFDESGALLTKGAMPASGGFNFDDDGRFIDPSRQNGKVDWGKKMSAAIDSYQANLWSIPAAMGSDYALKAMQENKAAADKGFAEAGGPQSWDEMEFGKNFGQYFGHLLVQSAPYMAEFAATGFGLGSVLKKGFSTAAETVAAKAAQEAVKRGATAEAAATIGNAAADGFFRTVGGVMGSYPSSVGDVLSNQQEQAGEFNLPAAAALGVPYAALNAAGVEGMFMRGVSRGLPTIAKEMAGKGALPFVGRAAITGAEVGAMEGATETGQEVLNQAGRMAVDPNASLTSDDAMARYKESFIAGGLLGGLPGAAVGGFRKAAPEDVMKAPDVDSAIEAADKALALPLYAGEPLVTMPDGSTMTRAEAERFRLDGMIQPVPVETKEEAIRLLTSQAGPPLVVFPDGSTMTAAEAERMRLGGMVQSAIEPAEPIDQSRVARIEAERERLRAMQEAAQGRQAQRDAADTALAGEQEFSDLMASEQSDLSFLRRDAAAAAQKDADFARAQEQVLGEQVDQAQALTAAQGFDETQQTAMQLAMQRARERRAAQVQPEAPAGGPAPVQESQDARQVQEAAQAAETVASEQGAGVDTRLDTPQAAPLTLSTSRRGSPIITGDAEAVKAAEPAIRAALTGVTIIPQRQDGGYALVLPKTADRAAVQSAIDAVNQGTANEPADRVADAAVAAPSSAGQGADVPGGGPDAQALAAGADVGLGQTPAEPVPGGEPAEPVRDEVRPAAVGEFETRPDGTIRVRGYPADQVRAVASQIGATALVGSSGGAVFAKGTSLKKLQEAFGYSAPPEKKAAPETPTKPMALSVGVAPGSAEPVTVRDGIVYLGDYPAQNFDTGENVTVPSGAGDQQIKDALTAAGAIGKRQRFFGASETAAAEPVSVADEIEAILPDGVQIDEPTAEDLAALGLNEQEIADETEEPAGGDAGAARQGAEEGAQGAADEGAARGGEGEQREQADEVAAAKATLDAAGITGTDRTTTIAAVRRGDLTSEDVAEAHPVAAVARESDGSAEIAQAVQEQQETAGDAGAEPPNQSVGMESRRAPLTTLPDAIIANPLNATEDNSNTYAYAKAGSVNHAMRLAKKLVTPDLVASLKDTAADNPLVVGVVSIEETGKNALPQAGAEVLANKLGLETSAEIVQATRPHRTHMSGLARVFNRPEFDGQVEPGRGYVLVDDTITQGGTLAAMANHIEAGGGRVVAIVALTGKQYSAKLSPSAESIQQVRDKFGDIENEFRQATGYGFDGLTESEARYLTKFNSPAAVRDRILAEARQAAKQQDEEDARGLAESRQEAPERGLSVSDDQRTESYKAVKAAIESFKQKLPGAAALDFHVASTAFDIPERYRPSPFAEGVYHSDAGLVYLVTMNLRSARGELDLNRVNQVLLHESVGHYGLMTMMGADFKPILGDVFRVARAKGDVSKVRVGDADYATVEAVKRDYPEASDDMVAMEVLARMAETGTGNKSLLQITLARIRQWLRKVAKQLGLSIDFTMDDARDLVMLSAEYLRRGDNLEAAPAGEMVLASQATEARDTIGRMSSKGAGAPSADNTPSPADAESGNKRSIVYDKRWFENDMTGLSERVKRVAYAEEDYRLPNLANAVPAQMVPKQAKQATVKLYRGVPTGIKDAAIRPGDWVAIEKRYAKEHGTGATGRNKVVELEVPADDVVWAGTDMNEYFYAPRNLVMEGESAVDALNRLGPQAFGEAATNEKSAPEWQGALESRAAIIGDSGRTYTPEQQRAFEATGRTVQKLTPKERIASMMQDAGKKMAQGIVDQFAPVKDIDPKAYTLLRLSKGATGAFEALMHHGKLSLRDGAYDADTTGGVLEKVFYPLGKESSDFLYWIAGNRAEKLAAEGRENLFTPEDIAAYKSLDKGVADFDYTLANGKTTRDRTLIYRDALKKFNEFSKNVLDMAEQSGLIDGDSRAIWESEFYVPFYRVADDQDGGVRGMNVKQGVVRQEAFKKLKGGTEGLNDLLANTLMNWAHLIDASAKNRGAKATLEAAKRMGAARKAIPGEKKTVWFMDNGRKAEYRVEDPYLLTALNGLEYAGLRGPAMEAMSAFKHWLTIGVTASPFFKVRNLIRDSMQAIATSDLNLNPITNVAEGFRLTDRERQEYVSALAGGGLIRFGTMLEGNEASRTRQLIKKGAKDATILDSESKVRAFYDKYLEPAISAYNELGNRGEEINRMALYDQLIKNGADHATASLMARDLMDFSMSGAWTSIRFLTQVVPFMNARLQGLYKLGRSAKQDPQRFAAVLGTVTLASLALLAAYSDDDDWKKREDWDRDTYWWFKFGGMAFRIPKPFEIGAMATLAERSAEYLFDNEMTGKRFRDRVTQLLSDQLSMNPVPQLVKPIVDVYANRDSFTGRPIETMGMERLEPEYRFRQGTSMVARGVSTAGNTATGGNFLSPVQVDHLVRGYFSWLGAFVVGGADMAVRAASNEPTKPAVDYWKVATGGMAAGLDSASSRYVSQMYEQAKELEQAYSTWRDLLKQGKRDEAAEYRADHQDELRRYRGVENVKRATSKLNERIRMIERSNMEPERKREAINRVRDEQDRIARRLAPA